MTTSTQTSLDLGKNVAGERRYFTVMALVMIGIAMAGFLPALVDQESRRAPLTPLAAVHAVVSSAWLLLFLVQSRLIATGRVAIHRRLGIVGVILLAVMIPLAYETTIEMVRRGFDLSGDQHLEPNPRAGYNDVEYGAVFNLCGLAIFATLAAAGLACRRKSEIHKRLMLYATIVTMGSPIAHFTGHMNLLSPALPLGVPAILLSSCVVRDYVVLRRVRPLTVALAVGIFASLPVQAAVIGPSAWWHRLVDWLAR